MSFCNFGKKRSTRKKPRLQYMPYAWWIGEKCCAGVFFVDCDTPLVCHPFQIVQCLLHSVCSHRGVFLLTTPHDEVVCVREQLWFLSVAHLSGHWWRLWEDSSLGYSVAKTDFLIWEKAPGLTAIPRAVYCRVGQGKWQLSREDLCWWRDILRSWKGQNGDSQEAGRQASNHRRTVQRKQCSH